LVMIGVARLSRDRRQRTLFVGDLYILTLLARHFEAIERHWKDFRERMRRRRPRP
jgi:hypothetical protein